MKYNFAEFLRVCDGQWQNKLFPCNCTRICRELRPVWELRPVCKDIVDFSKVNF